MKRKKLIIIGVFIIIVFAIVIMTLNFFGLLVFINQPLNIIIAGSPDKSCNVDSDCVLRATTCGPCDCGDAVNRNWYPSCPFPDNVQYRCKMCASQGRDFNIKCIQNLCQKVPISS